MAMELHQGVENLLADPAELFRDVLRISPEPCTYVDERQVHHRLTAEPASYVHFVRDRLRDVALGHAELELPPKQLFIDPDMAGDFRVMPCVLRHGGQVTKTVKIVGTNLAQTRVPDQITVGKAFALDPQDNFISHVFEACLLSSARTGVCASLAVDLLSEQPDTLAIIGAGRVGYYAAVYSQAMRPFRVIEIYDRTVERAHMLAAQLSRDLPGVQCRVLDDPAGSSAQVMVLATSSVEPICHPDAVGASLVISLGADTDAQHELAVEWLDVADIYVDTRDSARYGDVKQWQDAGRVRVEELTDLFQLMRGEPTAQRHPRRVFVSTGSAMFDNLTIAYLLGENGPVTG